MMQNGNEDIAPTSDESDYWGGRRRAAGPAAAVGRGRLIMAALAFFLALVAFLAVPRQQAPDANPQGVSGRDLGAELPADSTRR